ncbi:hypothetical protein SAMN04488137_1014 [Fictibacillus solisalsi]|uniref:Uncharacterized protein n=1 Tax=Fictibacillus solisalsi TaxID=459525 RepID=A0A1G9UMK4_9BACL|nr:hypothetical protein SAMN04488137_1014 [Fictibacillus solisalsi]
MLKRRKKPVIDISFLVEMAEREQSFRDNLLRLKLNNIELKNSLNLDRIQKGE